MLSLLKYKISRIKRYFSYARLGSETNDYDANHWITLIRFKLQSTYRALLNKDSIKSYKEYKSLRICIKLCDRIQNNFHTLNIKQHYKKWGNPVLEYRPISTDRGVVYELVDINRYFLSKEKTIEEFDDLLNSLRADDLHKEKEIRLLFRIIELYFQTWNEL